VCFLQARETLKHALRSQIAEKQAALAALRAQSASIKREVLAVTHQLAAVGGDAAESMQRPAAQQLQQQQQHAAAMEEG
jgi:peptidoglycan hydrolase CwlO-like protein